MTPLFYFGKFNKYNYLQTDAFLKRFYLNLRNLDSKK